MTDPSPPQQKKPHSHGALIKVEKSAIFTVIGIVLLFSTAIIITLLAPRYVDPTWTSPSSTYQMQMYEISDPNLYISGAFEGGSALQFVYHIKKDYSLLAFHESDTVRIVAPKDLEKFVTRHGDTTLKLTPHLLLLRHPQTNEEFDAASAAGKMRKELQTAWEKQHPAQKVKPSFEILELYDPKTSAAFALAPTDGAVENWVEDNFELVGGKLPSTYQNSDGVIYINNPKEYRISSYVFNDEQGWRYDPDGKPIASLDELQHHALKFRSRAELIAIGEHIYAIEGCWYCHTDQTRTLVQDVVLNGSDSYPAPPSSANEYIYQKITFPGTRRIGPDISRVGIKRPSRDWHKAHFWAPKTASKGSIMPSFRHFFDDDPRGTSSNKMGIPNYRFEAIYQYLMTKGTRITSPTQAWWLGKDPVRTKEIIEGRVVAPK